MVLGIRLTSQKSGLKRENKEKENHIVLSYLKMSLEAAPTFCSHEALQNRWLFCHLRVSALPAALKPRLVSETLWCK